MYVGSTPCGSAANAYTLQTSEFKYSLVLSVLLLTEIAQCSLSVPCTVQMPTNTAHIPWWWYNERKKKKYCHNTIQIMVLV
jgi:hypothetical protein